MVARISAPMTRSATAHGGTVPSGSGAYTALAKGWARVAVRGGTRTVPDQATRRAPSRSRTVHGSCPLVRPGALTGSTALPPGRTASMMTGQEWRRPPGWQETCPVARANAWPVLRTGMYRRGVDPIHPAETAWITRAVRSRDSGPTVTAMPTVTLSMMMMVVDTGPSEPARTARGRGADSAVMPARYCPGGVLWGTAIVKARTLRAPGARVTVAGSPPTQQPAPAHLPVMSS